MRCLLFSLFVLIFCCTNAQTINLGDSLRHVFKQRVSPSIKFDTRNSFITGRTATVYGVKGGVNFGTRLSVGLGYNFIGTELTEEVIFEGELVRADIRMNYIAPFLEYSFYQRGPWVVSTPIQFGIGNSFLCYDSETGRRNFSKGRVVVYEPGMAFEFKILKLIGVGAGMGYRIMLKNNRDIEQQFTSPIYALRVRLIFDEIYRRYKSSEASNISN
jgi:hypothetical protein